MFNTLTYTVRVETTPDQSKTLSDTCSAYDDRVAAMNIQRLGYQSVVESQSDKL